MRRYSGSTAPDTLHSTTGRRVTGAVSVAPPPTFALVQHSSGQFSSGSGAFTTWKPSAGNLLIFLANANNIVDTPTDNGANSWTLAQSIIDGNAVYIWWRVATATDQSSLTHINVSLEGSNFNCIVELLEFSGIATTTPYDMGAQKEKTGTADAFTTLDASLVTTGVNGDLVIAFVGLHSAPEVFSDPSPNSWTNGYTEISEPVHYSATTASALVSHTAYLQQTPAGATNTVGSWAFSYPEVQLMVSSWNLA